jgi:MFS family permease
VGLAVNGFAFVFLSYLTAAATPLQVVGGLALVGIGMGLFQTPNNNLLMSSVPRNRLGVGSSVLSIVRSLGYSIGAALGAMIVSSQLAALTGQTSLQFSAGQLLAGGGASARVGFLNGFRLALLSAAGLCFLGAALSLVRVSKEIAARR